MECCRERPNRSDDHLSVEEEAKLEAKAREYFDEAAPKRHTKPQRSEYSTQYVDALSNSNSNNDNNNNNDNNFIPELVEFQRLENDPQVGFSFWTTSIYFSICLFEKMKKIIIRKNVFASAGSRTRVYCLEGNYPNRWTTNACCNVFLFIIIYPCL